ncbi:hypothetical protein PDL06_11145 [Bacillus cereus group sp. TH208-1LC]|nr:MULTISPECIES: hypothetical protein [Bacillus cereus group]ASI80362.1 hypothetical protein BA202_25030 [Bacillus cereus]MDA1606707.1 hypothetical protein [Bacillus cereus group sp. TH208-1LC]
MLTVYNTIKTIEIFFDKMTPTSTTFLSGSSAVIAALLALTTIIFSQFNERLLQKTSDISREIKISISKSEGNHELINNKINEIIYLLSNQAVYKMTLYFFLFISYLSGFLWIIAGIGNVFEVISSKSYGDLALIILSTLAIALTFFVLPILLIKFNKNPVLNVDSKNRVTFNEIKKYFHSITNISVENIIKKYLQPALTFRLGNKGALLISLKQEIPISNVDYIFEFVGSNNIKQLVKITNSSSENFIEYEINPSNKNGTSFKGLFTLISKSKHQNLYVYSKNSEELVASFTLKFLEGTDTDIELVLNIEKEFNLTPDLEDVLNVLSSKKWIHRISDDEKEEYSLRQRNKK